RRGPVLYPPGATAAATRLRLWTCPDCGRGDDVRGDSEDRLRRPDGGHAGIRHRGDDAVYLQHRQWAYRGAGPAPSAEGSGRASQGGQGGSRCARPGLPGVLRLWAAALRKAIARKPQEKFDATSEDRGGVELFAAKPAQERT